MTRQTIGHIARIVYPLLRQHGEVVATPGVPRSAATARLEYPNPRYQPRPAFHAHNPRSPRCSGTTYVLRLRTPNPALVRALDRYGLIPPDLRPTHGGRTILLRIYT